MIGFSFPVVPRGEARIRVQLSPAHSTEDVDFAIAQFVAVRDELAAGGIHRVQASSRFHSKITPSIDFSRRSIIS
ncbi:MAG: hypothetical protein CM1200mP2_03380 [Planctomycetaceae bacterium]|nr:MAG: hypothetical protein CM1200mP2_03380 [Planctomycetaceae bacterium]